jgi:hypothetical protein
MVNIVCVHNEHSTQNPRGNFASGFFFLPQVAVPVQSAGESG